MVRKTKHGVNQEELIATLEYLPHDSHEGAGPKPDDPYTLTLFP